jgi:predicted ArsR family transcriptional regulator
VLAEYGYEPRHAGDEVHLVNCPFHALAQEQTELACGMNHALINGIVDALTPHCPQTRLQPIPGQCCVVLAPSAG